MKKLIIFLSLFLFCGCGYCKTSNELNILTLFTSESNSQNKVWVGTFQLVFNDMKNNIIKSKIEFIGEKPTKELIGLNKEEFKSDMLNPESYYTSWGEKTPEAKEKIKSDLKEKFNTNSDIIDRFDWSKEPLPSYYAYAMLKKDFDFLEPFDELENRAFNNSKEKYKFFGIKEDSKSKLYDNVSPLFYNNQNDYAVKLNTSQNDIVYLYRTNSNDDFKKIYNTMLKKTHKFKGEREFQKDDTLTIPNLKFKKEREYPELCNKRIKGTDMFFSNALETIQFTLDKNGGHVKSEAIIMAKTCALIPFQNRKPRHYDFDKTFIIFLIDKGKQDPYMALRVKDLKDLQ